MQTKYYLTDTHTFLSTSVYIARDLLCSHTFAECSPYLCGQLSMGSSQACSRWSFYANCSPFGRGQARVFRCLVLLDRYHLVREHLRTLNAGILSHLTNTEDLIGAIHWAGAGGVIIKSLHRCGGREDGFGNPAAESWGNCYLITFTFLWRRSCYLFRMKRD